MLSLIVLLIIVGVGLYLVNSVIPMDAKIKTILNVVVIIAVLVYIAGAFGLLEGWPHACRVR